MTIDINAFDAFMAAYWENGPTGLGMRRSLEAYESAKVLSAAKGEVVGLMAKAIYENNPAVSNGKAMSWEDCGEAFPERVSECMGDAQAALAALLERYKLVER